MKEKIANTALKMFLSLGFKSVTMDDIASELAISKKTIYKYFNNKESLIKETVVLARISWLKKIKEIDVKNLTAIKESFAIINAIHEIFMTIGHSPMYQLKKYYNSIYQDIVINDTQLNKDILIENIKKGISQGLYRKEVDIDVCVDFYFSLCMLLNERLLTSEELKILELQALTYHLRAIATPKGVEELELQLK